MHKVLSELKRIDIMTAYGIIKEFDASSSVLHGKDGNKWRPKSASSCENISVPLNMLKSVRHVLMNWS